MVGTTTGHTLLTHLFNFCLLLPRPLFLSRSRFTFLIYLNDDFKGGCTTFYTPNKREGYLDAQAVRPVTVVMHFCCFVSLLPACCCVLWFAWQSEI